MRDELKIDTIEKSSYRLDSIDIVKGIAMIAIVAGHLGVSSIEKFVFTFHVPLFFLISGYLYRYQEGIVKKRFFQLIKPYLFTVASLFVFDEFKNVINLLLGRGNLYEIEYAIIKWGGGALYASGSRTDFLGVNIYAIGAVWFFIAMIWSTFFLQTGIKFGELIKIHYGWKMDILLFSYSVTLFIIGIVTAEWTWLPLSLQAGMAGTLFLWIGYFYKERAESGNSRFWVVIRWLLIIVWLFGIYLSFVGDNMSLVKCKFPNPEINIIGAVGGAFAIIKISKLLARTTITKKYLTYLGKNTLIALCFHMIEMVFVPWWVIERVIGTGAISLALILIGKLIFIYFAIWIVGKFPRITKIFK